MNLSFFTSLFKKDNTSLSLVDSILVKQLKAVSISNSFSLFNNVTIFHHTNTYHIPLMLLDESRGLYIFEKKEWSYDDLKNATVEKAQQQESSNSTLSYQKSQNLINQKFNELTHHDSVPIFNYLLMENLNTAEYEHLNDSFQELLPKDRVIFNDSTQEVILDKLHDVKRSELPLPPSKDIIGNLLIQYTILENNNALEICTQEQINFIDASISGVEILNAVSRSGKSNTLLLKAILHILKNRDEKIIIIKPTVLSCDIFKKKILDIVEHAIIDIDLTQISILTPLELVNLHLKKLNKSPIKEKLYIDNILLKKKFKIAEFLMCDDANLYEDYFIDYLRHIQKNANLLLVNKKTKNAKYSFTKSFTADTKTILFYQANQHAKTLLVISKLLLNEEAKSILIVGNSLSKEQLHHDLEHFIEEKSYLLDSSQNLINQSLDSLLLANYADINELNADHIILLDTCFSNFGEVEYAIGLAKKSVTIIYEKKCETINKLKEEYENNEE
ncbi:MAG: hypothetical protein QM497_08365 [Sulfurimonas sp.]